jgi:hypothetical protein
MKKTPWGSSDGGIGLNHLTPQRVRIPVAASLFAGATPNATPI